MIKVKLDSGQLLHVECSVVKSLCGDVVLGMPFLEATNPTIDWQSYTLQIGDASVLATAPLFSAELRPSITEVSAKTLVRLMKQESSKAWFWLIRGSESIQTGLLASAEGTSNPFAAAPLAYHSLLLQFSNVFDPPGTPVPQQIPHRIELINESAPAPRKRAYRMSSAEMAESRR